MKHYQPIRHYETTIIYRPTLSESELQAQIETLKAHLASNEATIHKSDLWGRRKLAYRIGNFSEGIYLFLVFTGKPETVALLARQFQINENVMRYLTVKSETPLEAMPPVSLDETPEAAKAKRQAANDDDDDDDIRGPRAPRRDEDDDE